MEKGKVVLDYASQPPPWHRRKSVRRWMLVILLIVLSILALEWGPSFWKHIRDLYWQHKCMTYIAPPDQVVYDEDPAKVAALEKQPDYFATTFRRMRQRAVAYRPSPWTKFMYGWSGNGIIFMHGRSTPGSQPRLVQVDSYSDYNSVELYAKVILTGSMFQAPQKLWHKCFIYDWVLDDSPRRYRIRFFAGQIDANDSSHFTMKYEADDKSGIIDGWLQNDNSVDIQIRNGPLK